MLMDTKEAAAFLKVKPATLANWRSAKVGPPYIKRGRRVFYEEDVLERFCEVWKDDPALTRLPSSGVAAKSKRERALERKIAALEKKVREMEAEISGMMTLEDVVLMKNKGAKRVYQEITGRSIRRGEDPRSVLAFELSGRRKLLLCNHDTLETIFDEDDEWEWVPN